MSECPISFSPIMVRAILEGRKTQTRRVVKPPEPESINGKTWKPDRYNKGKEWAFWEQNNGQWTGRCGELFTCPYGRVGDRLWVRETAVITPVDFSGIMPGGVCTDDKGNFRIVQYIATTPSTHAAKSYSLKITSPRFMPRWASRILLEITDVRVQRLQAITEQDAQAEGVTLDYPVGNIRAALEAPYTYGYAQLWDKINGIGAWDANPWVWVLEFRRVQP